MYRAYGRTAEAFALFEQVRERRTMLLGASHPSTLRVLTELAFGYRDDGQLDKALPLAEQLAAGLERLQFAHVEAARMIDAVCSCHEGLGQYDRAEVWRRKYLAVVREKDGPGSAQYAQQLGELGANLLKQQRYADAETVLRGSLAIRQAKQPGDWWTYTTQSLLGAALLGQQKYADAEPQLLQGYQGMSRAANDPGHARHGASTAERLAEARERIVQLYDAWGRKDQANEWRRKGEEGKAPSQPPAGP
jgi:hypothetical protein